MPKAIPGNKTILLAMALVLRVSFMGAHPVSADPPTNDGKADLRTANGPKRQPGKAL